MDWISVVMGATLENQKGQDLGPDRPGEGQHLSGGSESTLG